PEKAKLTASDAAAGDQFGWSVSISGNYAVVGAFANDDAGSSSGSAYVFVLQAGVWVEQAKLTALNALSGDLFGTSVATDGNFAVIGAPSNNAAAADAGAVYVFRRSGTTWIQQAMLVAPDAITNHEFGAAVAISGDRIIIGAPRDNHAGNRTGAAYVYIRNDNGTPGDPTDDSWVVEQKLTASDAAAGDRYGSAVALDGALAVVGAYGNEDMGSFSGSAYLYRWDAATWFEEAKLAPADLAASDAFGYAVGVSGSYVLVGAYQDDDTAMDSGSAYIFALSGPDCNVNGLIDECDVAAGTSGDCNSDGILNECQGELADSDNDGITDACDVCRGFTDRQDEDGDGVPDGCDQCPGIDDSADCDGDGTPDCSAIANCAGDPSCGDCNGNGVPDGCDITAGDSLDCNANSTPDVCDIANCPPGDIACDDCDSSGIPDGCEIAEGSVPDCNVNSIPDACDVAAGTSLDCAGEGIPDECEPDCDGNSVADSCDILTCPGALWCSDCNSNGVLDPCDLAAGTSVDLDGNGVPDECDTQPALAAAPPHDVPKNRYVSFNPNNTDLTAFHLELASMKRCAGRLSWTCATDADCPLFCAGSSSRDCTQDSDCRINRCSGNNAICTSDAECPFGQSCVFSGTDLGPCQSTGPCVEHGDVGTLDAWIGAPFDPSCQNDDGTPAPGNPPCLDKDRVSRVVGAPVFRIWSENPVHVGDCEIVPVATYEIRASGDGIVFTPPVLVGTIRKPGPRHYGDTAGEGTGNLPPLAGFTPPNQVVNVVDVAAYLLTLQGDSTPSAHTTWVDLHGLGAEDPVCTISGTPASMTPTAPRASCAGFLRTVCLRTSF
ncbi:MAG: hypothetical protein ACE5HE_06475, partial [Phycisphaerae bacterium]